MLSHYLTFFFIPFILIRISLVYTDDIFLLIFIDNYFSNGKIQSINIIIMYQQKKSVDISIYICYSLTIHP
jgi:hypothetical protein